MVKKPERPSSHSFFRRKLATSGLAGLSALLGAHHIAVAAYLGPGHHDTDKVGTLPPGDRQPENHPATMTVNVMDFGARGDGISDDAPAVNAAIRTISEIHRKNGNFDLGCRIVFPAGIYAVDSSVNLTNLRRINTVIDGAGAAILGRCAGKPVIDALGTRWLMIRDLTVLGDPISVPDVGIQIGLLSSKTVADDHRFENVKVLGHFSRTCLYNRAAETTGFDHVLLWNNHPDSYCLIQDGLNHFGVVSEFNKTDVPRDVSLSFNENEFINCDFRHGAGGVPVWLGDTARHAFIRCYAATGGEAAFVVYCGQNSHLMLDVDCHCETAELREAFLFTGKSDRLIIRGFRYRDHRCFATQSVLHCDPRVRSIEMQNARLEIAGFAHASCRVFGQPDVWKASGCVYNADADHWNGGAVFTGMVALGSNIEHSGKLPALIQVIGIVSEEKPPAAYQGCLFRDKESNRLLIWTGSHWVDALGRPV